MYSNLVSKTVVAGQSVILQVDGCLTEFTGGQTVLLAPWDAVVFVAAGIVQ
jgi:hypothetical protein